VATEEWQSGFHKSLSDLGDAGARIHADEVRASVTKTLERIHGENMEAWAKFSHMVHSPSAQS